MKATIRSAVALATLLVLSGLPAAAQQYASPVGPTWDCLLSGSGQQGIAFLKLRHNEPNRAPSAATSSSSASKAPVTASASRGGKSAAVWAGVSLRDGSAPAAVAAPLFGFGTVNGPWRYDEKGRVVGYFVEILNQQTSVSTNEATQTVTDGLRSTSPMRMARSPRGTTNVTIITTNISYTTNVTGTTNSHQLQRKGRPRPTADPGLFHTYGKVTYRGVPQSHRVSKISGSWSGRQESEQHRSSWRFFNLTTAAIGFNPYVSTDVTNDETSTSQPMAMVRASV